MMTHDVDLDLGFDGDDTVSSPSKPLFLAPPEPIDKIRRPHRRQCWPSGEASPATFLLYSDSKVPTIVNPSVQAFTLCQARYCARCDPLRSHPAASDASRG